LRSDRLRLLDVRDSLDVIAAYLPPDRATFDADEPLQSHLYRHLQIVGEAMWKVSKPLKEAHPQVPWRQIQSMRHIMVHDYFDIDWEVVWRAATTHAPALRPDVEKMLATLPPDEDEEGDG
jgi:uncharacterized protein with HEPN domain